jgi:hypothetical protein
VLTAAVAVAVAVGAGGTAVICTQCLYRERYCKLLRHVVCRTAVKVYATMYVCVWSSVRVMLVKEVAVEIVTGGSSTTQYKDSTSLHIVPVPVTIQCTVSILYNTSYVTRLNQP